jgi:hypothetical protein
MRYTRRQALLSGIAGSMSLTAGCAGFGESEPEPDDNSGAISFQIKNRTEEKRTLTLRVRRPLGWTPTDSTSTPSTPVTNRELTLDPGAERLLEDVIADSGRHVVVAKLDHENEDPYSDRTARTLRVDTKEASSSRIDIDIWRLEEFPEFDKSIPDDFPAYYHLELAFSD